MTISNKQPTFVHHPVVVQTDIPATADTARSAPTTVTTIYTADSAVNGSLVENIHCIATGTTAAGILNLWYKAGGSGTWKLIGQLAVTAVTPSTTAIAWEGDFSGAYMPLRLSQNDTIGISTTIAQAFSVEVQGGPLANSDV